MIDSPNTLTSLELSELKNLKGRARKLEVDEIKVEKAYLALGKYRDYIRKRAIAFNPQFTESSKLNPLCLFMFDCVDAYEEFLIEEKEKQTPREIEKTNNEMNKHLNNLLRKVRRGIRQELPLKPSVIKRLKIILDDVVFCAHSPREIERIKNGLPETAHEIEVLIINLQDYKVMTTYSEFIERVLSSLKWWSDIDRPNPCIVSKNKDKHYLIHMLEAFIPPINGYSSMLAHYEIVYSHEVERMYRGKKNNHIGHKFIIPRAESNNPVSPRLDRKQRIKSKSGYDPQIVHKAFLCSYSV